MTAATVFFTVRFIFFGLLLILNALNAIIAIWALSAARPAGFTLPSAGLMVALSLITFACIAFFIFFLSRLRAKRKMRDPGWAASVWFELTWVGIAWVAQLIAAAMLSGEAPRKACRGQESASECSAAKGLLVTSWLTTLTLLAYFALLLTCTILHHKDNPKVWHKSVASFDWFPATPLSSPFSKHSRGTPPLPTVAPWVEKPLPQPPPDRPPSIIISPADISAVVEQDEDEGEDEGQEPRDNVAPMVDHAPNRDLWTKRNGDASSYLDPPAWAKALTRKVTRARHSVFPRKPSNRRKKKSRRGSIGSSSIKTRKTGKSTGGWLTPRTPRTPRTPHPPHSPAPSSQQPPVPPIAVQLHDPGFLPRASSPAGPPGK